MQHCRSAEGLLSDAIAQKTKLGRSKVLLKARLTAVTRGTGKGKGGEETRSGGGDQDQAASRQASDSCGSNHGCPRCNGFNTETPAPARPRKEGTQSGGGTAGVDVRETRQAGNGEKRERLQQQQQPREQEQETRRGLFEEPAFKPEDSGLAGRQQGHRSDGPPAGRHCSPKIGPQRNSRGPGGQEVEPEAQQGLRDALEGQEKVELELKQEIERERREFEAARQRLEQERQESSEAAQHAETRVREVEAAWQSLAGKVVSLAERNAGLEWVR